jgi:hypothetical protein
MRLGAFLEVEHSFEANSHCAHEQQRLRLLKACLQTNPTGVTLDRQVEAVIVLPYGDENLEPAVNREAARDLPKWGRNGHRQVGQPSMRFYVTTRVRLARVFGGSA